MRTAVKRIVDVVDRHGRIGRVGLTVEVDVEEVNQVRLGAAATVERNRSLDEGPPEGFAEVGPKRQGNPLRQPGQKLFRCSRITEGSRRNRQGPGIFCSRPFSTSPERPALSSWPSSTFSNASRISVQQAVVVAIRGAIMGR